MFGVAIPVRLDDVQADRTAATYRTAKSICDILRHLALTRRKLVGLWSYLHSEDLSALKVMLVVRIRNFHQSRD